jgi:hypothetical protein
MAMPTITQLVNAFMRASPLVVTALHRVRDAGGFHHLAPANVLGLQELVQLSSALDVFMAIPSA